MSVLCPHLSLNAVEPSEPEDLSSPQLPLCVVDLLVFFVDVLLWQLIFLSELPRPPQEAQPAVGYGGYHLIRRQVKALSDAGAKNDALTEEMHRRKN